MTTPFSTATPNSAMKPTDAATLRFCPEMNSPITPPINANGMLSTMSVALRSEPKLENSSRKISSTTSGTTIDNRAMARC